MQSSDVPKKSSRRVSNAKLPESKTYSPIKVMIRCWKCNISFSREQLQEHLDKNHKDWQYDAIKRMGISIVNE